MAPKTDPSRKTRFVLTPARMADLVNYMREHRNEILSVSRQEAVDSLNAHFGFDMTVAAIMTIEKSLDWPARASVKKEQKIKQAGGVPVERFELLQEQTLWLALHLKSLYIQRNQPCPEELAQIIVDIRKDRGEM